MPPTRKYLFGFPTVALLALGLIQLAGRWTIPTEVRQMEMVRDYGIPPALVESPGTLETLARLAGGPGAYPQEVVLPPGSTESSRGPRLIFPHFGDGQAPSIGRTMQTIVNLQNDGAYPARVEIDFFDDAGNPLQLKAGTVTQSHFALTITAGRSVRLVTAGEGPLKSGWIRVTSDQPVSGNTTFSLKDSLAWVRTDVGVGESVRHTEYTVFADTLGSANTGLALCNPDPDSPLHLQFEFRGTDGALKPNGTYTLTLGPRAHWARFVNEIFTKVAGIGETEGSILVRGDLPFSGIALRSVDQVLTSVPLVPAPAPDLTREKLVFPHLADGSAGSLRISTSLILINNTAVTVTGNLEFHNSDGTPMTVVIGGQSNSVFLYTLAPGAVRRFATSGLGSLKTGWAQVTMDHPLGAAGIFQIRENAGRILSEVGVNAAVPIGEFNLVADTRGLPGAQGQARTGFALANPSDESVEVNMDLFDSRGEWISTKEVALPAFSHQSVFIDEIFNEVGNIRDFYGSLRFSAEEPVSAISLRQVDTLTTSMPLLYPSRGFAPVSVVELTQNLAGTRSSLRWHLGQQGTDLSLNGLTVNIPALGLDLSSVDEGGRIGFGLWYVALGTNSLGGTGEISLIEKNPMKFQITVMGSLFGTSGLPLATGELRGNPTGGFQLILDPTDLGLGAWNRGIGVEVDLFLLPQIIKLPASAGAITVTTEFESVSTKVDEADVPVLRTTVQPLTVAAPVAGAPQVHKIQPLFLVTGQQVEVTGTGFNQNSVVLFPGPDGIPIQMPALAWASGTLQSDIPSGVVDGPLRVLNGATQSNGLEAKVLFAPEAEVVAAGNPGAQGQPMAFQFLQGPGQLATAGYLWTVRNANRSLAGLAVDTEVGKLRNSLDGVLSSEFVVKVFESAADRLVLQAFNGTTLQATVTVRPTTEGITGLSLEYAPKTAVTAPLVFSQKVLLELSLPGLPFLVGVDGSPGITWTANLKSAPASAGGAGSSLQVLISQ